MDMENNSSYSYGDVFHPAGASLQGLSFRLALTPRPHTHFRTGAQVSLHVFLAGQKTHKPGTELWLVSWEFPESPFKYWRCGDLRAEGRKDL